MGPPVRYTPPSSSHAPPSLDDLIVVTWNMAVGAGNLEALVHDLRAGRLTNGRTVSRFVLLVQEAVRRGAEVPPFAAGMHAADAIGPLSGPDVAELARRLHLFLVYVPSMRNGPRRREDSGNAVLSTDALGAAEAVELPFVHQRRVAVGVAIDVEAGGAPTPLRVMNVHVETRGRTLGWLGNPRGRQTAFVVDWLERPRVERACDDTLLGGDFNTVIGGADEPAYRLARRWATGLAREDPRDTHMAMGRTDYLFFRSCRGATLTTWRVDERYGSDHHPVAACFGTSCAASGPPPDF